MQSAPSPSGAGTQQTIFRMRWQIDMQHLFHHEAMATGFRLALIAEDRRYAAQAAREAFDLLDQLERRWSRYIANSEISRVNALSAGSQTHVHPVTIDCISLALRFCRDTGGAFDISFRTRRARGNTPPVSVDAANSQLTVLWAEPQLDLGGIGKGRALDLMAELLRRWDLPHHRIEASASTVLCGSVPTGHPAWQVRIGPPASGWKANVVSGAVSGSGIAVDPHHLHDPATGGTPRRHVQAWSAARSAAAADALSTAFFVMSKAAIASYCRRHPQVMAAVQGSPPAVPIMVQRGAFDWRRQTPP